jgi:hypothetical protein
MRTKSYHIAIPGTMSLAAVKQAALDVLSTAQDEGYGFEVLQPERLLRTMSKWDAERSRNRELPARPCPVVVGHQIPADLKIERLSRAIAIQACAEYS